MGVNWICCVPTAGCVTSGVGLGEKRLVYLFVDADICWKRREVGQRGRSLSGRIGKYSQHKIGNVLYSYIVYIEEFYSISLIFARPYGNDVGVEIKVEESEFRH